MGRIAVISIEIEIWEGLSLPKTRVAKVLCLGDELPVQRFVILDVPVLDNQPISYPHDVGR